MNSDNIVAMPENAARVFRNALHEMQLQSLLCDVTLIADDGSQLSAHRAVLAATSPFFRQRFAAPLISTSADDNDDNAHVRLPGIAAATLPIVVEHLYTGRVRPTAATVHALLDAAALLQLPALRDVCLQLMRTYLQRPQVMMVVDTKFSQFYDFDERRWLDVEESTFGNVSRLAALVHDKMVYAITNEKDHMAVYNTVTRTWKNEPFHLQHDRTYRGTVAMLNGRIYVLGGYDGATEGIDIFLNRVDVYEVRAQRWQKMAPMLSVRYKCSAIAMDGRLYAVGGYNGQYLATAERYDPATNTWEAIASMLQPRRSAAIAELDGQLYIIGGIDESDFMKSVEVYDPQSNTWRSLPDMPPQFLPAMVAHAGELYVLNCSGNCNVHVFSPATNKWRQLAAPMPKSVYKGVMCMFDKPE